MQTRPRLYSTAKNPPIASKAVCPVQEEKGHVSPYLTWVHQSDGFCYYKCESCGWIKPDQKENETKKIRPAIGLTILLNLLFILLILHSGALK